MGVASVYLSREAVKDAEKAREIQRKWAAPQVGRAVFYGKPPFGSRRDGRRLRVNSFRKGR